MSEQRFNAEQIIASLVAAKGMITIAASRLNCSPDAIYSYVKRYPTVAAALKHEREKVTDMAELSLYKKIQEGEAWAICFYLKTQGKDRGYVERREVAGPGGGTIQVHTVSDLVNLALANGAAENADGDETADTGGTAPGYRDNN